MSLLSQDKDTSAGAVDLVVRSLKNVNTQLDVEMYSALTYEYFPPYRVLKDAGTPCSAAD